MRFNGKRIMLQLSSDGFAFTRIFHLRNFNNWIKSMLINEYSNKIKATKRQKREEAGEGKN
jgi:hypothetical protein